jgi:hypothetical protein
LGQYCDTRPGETLGSCQEPVAECVGKTPGALLCQQNDVYACGVDALTTEFVGDCPELCDAGQCAPIGACPTGTNWIKCSQDCPEHGYDEDECGESDDPYPRADLSAANAVRTPAAADMNQCANQRRRMPIRDGSPTRIDLRLRVQPPWSLVLGANSDGCAAPLGITCAVMEASGTNLVTVFTDDQSAPPANMVVEHLPAGSDEACP